MPTPLRRWVGVVVLLAAALRLPAETVAFLGDSLTAGYGLDESQAYPALIQDQLRLSAPQWNVINSGVSGDTSAGAVRRVTWVLKAKPTVVVVAIGANDGLRGLPVAQLEANLTLIIGAIMAAGVKPLLVGMQLPTNFGPDYRTDFAAVFPRVAAQTHVPLLPFLLAGVAMEPKLNQADGIHPNAEGQKRVAATVLAFLRPHLGLAQP